MSWSRGNSVLSSLLFPFMTYMSKQVKQAMLMTKSIEQQSQRALHVSCRRHKVLVLTDKHQETRNVNHTLSFKEMYKLFSSKRAGN